MNLYPRELSPTHRVSAPAPTVDHYVRETYNGLLSLPVSEQIYDLVRSYGQNSQAQSQAEERQNDGTTD
jgi:hypothetical protein